MQTSAFVHLGLGLGIGFSVVVRYSSAAPLAPRLSLWISSTVHRSCRVCLPSLILLHLLTQVSVKPFCLCCNTAYESSWFVDFAMDFMGLFPARLSHSMKLQRKDELIY